jgi:thiamine pyrophosphate-dependent acetolactate synthase large subunit-like protein|tara:strand:- start:858 stop:974 length:117 start_codon:yes stop_codon:yes gene_type:complete
MGVAGEKLEDLEALGPALSKAYTSGKPAVIDVSIDGGL